jgi:hypothetical protein
MENITFKLANLKIPNKSIMNFYAYYYDGTEYKESILQNNPTKSRGINADCPEEVDLFTHMKICLISYFHGEVDDQIKALMHRIIKSSEREIEFGNFSLWNEEGNYFAVVDNVAKEIYFRKM